MLEGFGEFIQPEKWVDFTLNILYKIIIIPLKFWNSFPSWIRISFYVLVVLFALFIAIMTIKYKDLWRKRQY